eukprot:59369-Chlamydomonas_euryale.AAC.4
MFWKGLKSPELKQGPRVGRLDWTPLGWLISGTYPPTPPIPAHLRHVPTRPTYPGSSLAQTQPRRPVHTVLKACPS